MKRTVFCILIILISFPSSSLGAHNQGVTISEARNVGENFVRLVIYNQGTWGKYHDAHVSHVDVFKRGKRSLGYICFIEPSGCIIVPNTRQASPIKYFSMSQQLDPESEVGMVALIKDSLERHIEYLKRGINLRKHRYWRKRLDRYQKSWNELTKAPVAYQDNMESGIITMNYQQGRVLMETYWHQREPYNAQCPEKGCSWKCGSNTNAVVGCASTAASQIMKYWNWPPYGTIPPYSDGYDWPNMPLLFSGCSWDPVKVDAVAELCYEVGLGFNSSYGCEGTGAHASLLDLLPYFRYSNNAVLKKRKDYNNETWEEMIVSELEENRPIYYHIPGHQIVVDGWATDLVGGRLFHINYGHGSSSNTGWFGIDEIPGGYPSQEAMIIQVYPDCAIGGTFSGSYYAGSFPYRYFDQDAVGDRAIFGTGHKLHFLHDVVVRCGSLQTNYVKFYGSSLHPTILFSRGDESKGIALIGNSSTLMLYQGGSIRFE